ncbi:MAG TPA: ABC transporter permease [Micromonosporaceae bacterium]|jgi:ribose transport system permease protein
MTTGTASTASASGAAPVADSPAGPDAASARPPLLATYLPRLLPRVRQSGILIPFVILFVVLAVSNPRFVKTANLLNILDQQSATVIIAAAGTFVLIAGGIDLSVGAVYALCAAVAARVVQTQPIWVSVVVALLVGLAIGLVNGVVSTVLRINSLIATLAMSFIVAGIGNQVVAGYGGLIRVFERPGYNKIAWTRWLGAMTSVWIMLGVLVILGLILSRTTFGRYIYAVGGNAEAARLAGVRITAVRIAAFAASGVAAALGGVITLSRTQTSTGVADTTLTFTVLAAIVVGGTSILGGDGALWRTVIGALFIALVGNGFDLLGADPLYKQITLGVLLLLAVGLDAWSRLSRR